MVAARPAVVGGFVLGGLALLVLGILFFGGSRLFAHTTQAVIYFEGSVAGLDIGSPVTFRGVRVGSVQHIALEVTPQGQARIPVTIELQPGQVNFSSQDLRNGTISVERLVEAGLRAQLNLQSFVTGQLRIDLDFQPRTAAQMLPGNESLPQIPALPSDLERLRTTLSQIPVAELAQNLRHVLGSVEHLTTRLDTEMGPLLDSTKQSVDAATRTLNTTDQAVGSLRDQASQTLTTLDALAKTAQSQIDGRGDDVQKLLKSLDRITQQTDLLLTDLNNMTSPRSPLRGNLDAAARDLAASASSLRGFANTIERDPSALLRGRSGR
jgi:paraquat-inducible protein B